MRPIVLIGMMGSGKTTIGKKLAKKTLTRTEAIDAGKEGTLRTAYFLKGRTHPGAHNSFAAEEYILDFMNVTLKAGQPDGIPASSQIWLIKNIAGLVCLICFFQIGRASCRERV